MLVLGPTGDARDPRGQRVLGHGRRRAAAHGAPPLPGLQPAEPAARPVAAARRRSWAARASVGAAASASSAGRPTTGRTGSSCRRTSSTSCASSSGRPGSVANANALLTDPADGLRIINDVDQLAMFEWASCVTSSGVRRLLRGLRPGLRESEAVALLGWNGMPLSCHVMLTAGPRATLRAAQPERPADRARRPVHHRVRDLGRPHLPGGLRRRGRRRAAGRDRRLRRPARRAVLRGGRRVVRRAPRRADRRGAAGHHRPAPGRPVLRDLPQPGPPAPPRRVGQLAGLARAPRSSSARGWRCRSTSSRRPARRTSRPTSRTASPSRTRRCAPSFAAAYPEAWARIEARRRFMADALGIDLHPDVLPFSNLAAALPPFLLRPDLVMTVA